MIANALLMTLAIFLAYVFWLMDQLKFMAPYKLFFLMPTERRSSFPRPFCS